MSHVSEVIQDRPAPISRRSWLIGSMIAAVGLRSQGAEPADSSEEVKAIQAQAKKAGIGPFRVSRTEHFLGIGDGPDRYRDAALGVCKELAAAYHKHFRDRGFPVEFPDRPMTVVTLKGRDSYEKLLDQTPGADVGGHFDRDINCLVIFDFRHDDEQAVANAERVNTFTLIHEGIHLLTFNTGLLNLKGDVPACVSEGLATYGEVWRPSGRLTFGLSNKYRLDVLAGAAGLIPVRLLIDDDKVFEKAQTEQLAYAQSWLLTHYFLRSNTRTPRFRAYLDAVRDRRDAASRIKDATASLGNLDRLDRDVKKYASRMIHG